MLSEQELQELIKELYPDTCDIDKAIVISEDKAKKVLGTEK